MTKVSLKYILMELGNKLVQQGYDPSRWHKYLLQKTNSEFVNSTTAIALLTEFINQSPEAQNILEEMGIDWET